MFQRHITLAVTWPYYVAIRYNDIIRRKNEFFKKKFDLQVGQCRLTPPGVSTIAFYGLSALDTQNTMIRFGPV